MSDTNSRKSMEQTNDEAKQAAASTLSATGACGAALSECLGVGGMGEVYRCGDDALQRDLAVKILKAELQGEAVIEERFLREARLTGSLQHPGIVPVHHLGRRPDGRPCYTMKLVRGRTFADMLRDEPAGSERLPRLLVVLEKVCQAVAFAHSKGIIHRDLKPGNIMVGEFGEVQVMDWGLAKELSRDEPAPPEEVTVNVTTVAQTEEAEGITRVGFALGTLAYMPTEQAAGDWDIVDERADVFALGAVLCEMLTGQPPYRAAKRDELLRQARRGDLSEALTQLEKCGADAALVDLCRECLAAERLQRPRHAGVLAERLASYQAEVRERLRQAELERARAEVKAREERKRRRLLAALALAALLLLGGGAVVWRQRQQRRAEADAAVAAALGEARLLLQQAQADPLTATVFDKAMSSARMAGDLARTSGASETMQRQAEDLLAEAKDATEQATKDRRLLARLLEARQPQERPKYSRDDKGMMTALATPTAEELFASAFRDWGLDVDATSTAEATSRLQACPSAMRTELIAALDEWSDQRRTDGKSKAEWTRLADLTKALDDNPDSLRRELREILARGRLRDNADRTRLRQLVERIDATKEPVLGLLTLARALRVAGAEAWAERMLRKAVAARPREVVLYHTLGDLLERQRPAEAVEFYRAARVLRPDLGVTLAKVLFNAKRTEEALDVFAALVKDNLDNPFLHLHQANILHAKHDLDDAMAGYKKAIDLAPNYSWAHNNLGNVLGEKGDIDGAIACHKKAIELDPKNASAYNNLGNMLKHKGDLDEAIACYKKAIELDPKDDHALNNLGIALVDEGDVDGGIACYQKAIELDPKGAVAHYNLGNALGKKGKPYDAIACYKKAIELDPKYSSAHNNLGAVLYENGDIDGAIACSKKTIELNPKNANAHNNLGNQLKQKGDLEDAIACYRKSIELDPKEASTHSNLGNALREKGDIDGAIACHKKAIELDPKNPSAHNNLGSCLEKKGQLDDAIACYKKAIELDPRFAIAHDNLGHALGKKGKPDDAIACYKKAIELNPKLSTAHNGLGTTLQDKGKLDEAIACYKRAILFNPKNVAAHWNLGLALSSKGDKVGTIDCYNKVIQLDPNHAQAYNNLGNILHDKGDLKGAIACLTKSIELDPKNALVHSNLGISLQDKGDLDSAIACHKKAIKLDPKFAHAHYNLGNALRSKGDMDGAIACYKKAIELAPQDAKAYNDLGATLSNIKGEDGGAIACFQKAIKLQPKYVLAYTNLGVVLGKKGDMDGAIACYKKAIELNPQFAESHYRLGNAMYVKSDVDGAIACYKKALDLNPKYAEVHCLLGNVLLERGQFAEAVNSLRHGHELGSKQPGWHIPSALWLRDAERLITLERKLPAILHSEESPANPEETVALASMCGHYMKRYIVAARLYADAFAADPKLAADWNAQYRYSAACYATRAAAGQSKDARLLPDKGASMFRRWALVWLRDDLANYVQLVEQNNPKTKQLIHQRLAHWRRDADFASVRDPQALERLSDPERAAWQALWLEVDELTKRLADK